MLLQVSSRAVVVIYTYLVLSVLLLVLISSSSSSSLVGVVNSFTLSSTSSSSPRSLIILAASNTASSIPSSIDNRDKQAIDSTKKAIDKPSNTNFPLIELEFPPLQSLNKLGDGSLRSTIEVDDANLKFVSKLLKSISLDVLNPFKSSIKKVTLVISSSSTNSFRTKAQKIATKGIDVIDSSAVVQEENTGMVYIFISPSSRGDYMMAQQLATANNANICKSSVVIVNGFAKGPNSISGLATMSYYLKPLTYNSQIAGYLIRSYPSLWTVLDSSSGVKAAKVLTTYTDKDILVQGTNTPDLRASGKLVQKSVDERAIAARSQR
jgi:hypothetical protein